jgi:hypothetical protein
MARVCVRLANGFNGRGRHHRYRGTLRPWAGTLGRDGSLPQPADGSPAVIRFLLRTRTCQLVLPRISISFPPSFCRDWDYANGRASVHASKHRKSTRTLYISPAIAVAKARIMSKAGWQVHVVDADGRMFHPEQFDQLLRFDSKRTSSPRSSLF